MAYTADQIAGLFAARLPAEGGYITNKQGCWLQSVACREQGRPAGGTVTGTLADGREWNLRHSGNRNGAFTLRLVSVQEQAAGQRAVAKQARQREIVEAMRVAFEAGDEAEVARLAQEMGALDNPVAPRTTADHGIEEWEVAPATTLTPEERARINEMARRYGPSGKFNRARAERDVIAARQDLEAIEELGPDALAAEVSALSVWLSDKYDGTPDEIFYRDERSVRRYERIERVIEAIDAELTSRQAAELAHANRANGD